MSPPQDSSGTKRRVVAGSIRRRVAAPLEQPALAVRDVLDGPSRTGSPTDFVVSEMQPEFLRVAGKCDRAGDRIAAFGRFLQEADDVFIVDLEKPKVGGLLKGAVLARESC